MAGCYAPAEAARLYDENSASADSEYVGNICKCVDIFDASSPDEAMIHIVLRFIMILSQSRVLSLSDVLW